MENSPSIFVTDTNIWIDMYQGQLVEAVFTLPYKFVTTDLIYEELKQPRGTTLSARGLKTKTLGPDLIQGMIGLIRKYPRPSRIDISGLVLACHLKIPLLSGDGDLRKAAGQEGLRLHGTLFLLDDMVKHDIITSTEAGKALQRMLTCGRRLPEKECAKRFNAWGMKDNSDV